MSYIIMFRNDPNYKGIDSFYRINGVFIDTNEPDPIKATRFPSRLEASYAAAAFYNPPIGKLVPEIVELRTSPQHSAAQKDPDRWYQNGSEYQQKPGPVSTQGQHEEDLAGSTVDNADYSALKSVEFQRTSQEILIYLPQGMKVYQELLQDGSTLLSLVGLEPLHHKGDASAATRPTRLHPDQIDLLHEVCHPSTLELWKKWEKKYDWTLP